MNKLKWLIWLIPLALILPIIYMLYAALFGAYFDSDQTGPATVLAVVGGLLLLLIWRMPNQSREPYMRYKEIRQATLREVLKKIDTMRVAKESGRSPSLDELENWLKDELEIGKGKKTLVRLAVRLTDLC
jgi:hypothetical protein